MFYTILPQWPLIKPRFRRIARFAPFIGILIGLFQSITWALLKLASWPNIAASLISLVIGIILTGGIHCDGLMDTADGIGAGEKKRYQAMKDSRVGAMGVQSLLIILILQVAAIVKLDSYAPFAFPIAAFWGRLSQIFAIGNYQYLGTDESNSLHRANWESTQKELKPSLIIIFSAIVIFFLSYDLNLYNIFLFILFFLSGLSSSLLIPYFLNKILGGHRGDTYGASLLITETINLLILGAIFAPI